MVRFRDISVCIYVLDTISLLGRILQFILDPWYDGNPRRDSHKFVFVTHVHEFIMMFVISVKQKIISWSKLWTSVYIIYITR